MPDSKSLDLDPPPANDLVHGVRDSPALLSAHSMSVPSANDVSVAVAIGVLLSG